MTYELKARATTRTPTEMAELYQEVWQPVPGLDVVRTALKPLGLRIEKSMASDRVYHVYDLNVLLLSYDSTDWELLNPAFPGDNAYRADQAIRQAIANQPKEAG
ncbi:MAG: hypothetical protein AAFX78_10155 [Cyanobacteria bacterium J06638_20]